MRFSIEIHLDDPRQLANTMDALRNWIDACGDNLPPVYHSDLRQATEGRPIMGRVEFRTCVSEELRLTDEDRKLLTEMQIAEGRQS